LSGDTYIEQAPKLERKGATERRQVTRGECAVSVVYDSRLKALPDRTLLELLPNECVSGSVVLNKFARLVGRSEENSALTPRNLLADVADERLVLAFELFQPVARRRPNLEEVGDDILGQVVLVNPDLGFSSAVLELARLALGLALGGGLAVFETLRFLDSVR
jgi:hypothetical protein